MQGENKLRVVDAVPKSGMSAITDQSTFQADLRRHVPSRSSSFCWVLFVGSVTALLCLPFIRTVVGLGVGDEGVLLNGADRMLRGSRLYADFFEFLPPGGFVLTAAWFGVTGISFGSARLLTILIVVGIACFTFLACRQAAKNAPLSAMLTIGWLAPSQGFVTLLSHHWLTTLFTMITVWALLASIEAPPRRLIWPLIAGAAAGAAVMVTPTRGALVMLAGVAGFLNRRRYRRELLVYLLGCAVVPAGLLAYVVEQQALGAAFEEVIRYPAEHYTSVNIVPYGFGTSLQTYPLKYVFPLAGLLTLAACVRDWRGCLGDRLLWLCAALGVAGFLGCLSRPDIAHIGFAAPLVFPLLAWSTNRLTQQWRPAHRHMVAAIVVVLWLPSALTFGWLAQWAFRCEPVLTPRGVVKFARPSGIVPLMARIAASPPGDTYFFYPYMAMMPFLTAREQVSKYDVFTPGYSSPLQYQDACLSVMRRATWVVIDRNWTNLDVLKGTFPSMQIAQPPETKAFEQALDKGFELSAQYQSFELRRRRDDVNDKICSGIVE